MSVSGRKIDCCSIVFLVRSLTSNLVSKKCELLELDFFHLSLLTMDRACFPKWFLQQTGSGVMVGGRAMTSPPHVFHCINDWYAIIRTLQEIEESWPGAMIGKNRLRSRNTRLKFKTAGKLPIIVEEFIEYIYPNLIKENRRMSTCNRLGLGTLGSQPIMPKNLPDHWPGDIVWWKFNFIYIRL